MLRFASAPLPFIGTTLAASAAIGTLFVSCGPAPLSAAAERGHAVFMNASNPNCTTCHELKHAGSKKGAGPNLDVLKPSRSQVIRSVTQGVGIMPAQNAVLTEEQIKDVAEYLAEVAGR